MKMDNFPQETSWTIIRTSDGSLISIGPTADENYMKRQEYSYTWDCLPCGYYEFTIKDSFGDGMCYGGVCGSYKLTVNGNTIAEGNESNMFQFLDTSAFSCNIFE